MKKRNPYDNMGCLNCRNYTGTQPVNVPNFKCGVGESLFRIYYCRKFKRKQANAPPEVRYGRTEK